MKERLSLKDKQVSLFVTCVVDMIYAYTGMSAGFGYALLGLVELQVDNALACKPVHNPPAGTFLKSSSLRRAVF